MKIAFFHELSHNSGARKVVNEYGKVLSSKNKIDLYYIDNKEDLITKKIFSSAFFFKFEQKKWKGNNWKIKLYKDTFELIKLYILHKNIAKLINKNNYDFIFINPSKYTQSPFVLNFLKGKKIYFCQEPLRIIYDPKISKINNLSPYLSVYEKLNRLKRKYIDQISIRKSDLIFCNSEFSNKNIREAYNLNAIVSYLGVNEKIFKPQNLKKQNDVLFIGNKSEIEGYNLLDKVIQLYKGKLKIKLILNDKRQLTDEQLVNEYNSSKLTLVLSRNEPFGLIPIESMACGVPVVALNEGGLKESVINGETGYLVAPDKEKLKEKIDFLLNNEKLRKDMGEKSRNLILNKFTWEKSANNFLDIVKTNL